MVRMAGEDFLPTNSRDKKQRTLSITISPKFQGPGDSSLGFLSALAYSPDSSKPPVGRQRLGLSCSPAFSVRTLGAL